MIILLTVFIDLVGFSIIFPLFPDMLEYYLGKEPDGSWLHQLVASLENLSGREGAEARFAATVFFGGLLGSLYSLLQFVAAPLWGSLSDRIGRRKVLIFTVTGIAISYLCWFVAEPFWLLIVARVIGGAMAGNLSVASAAIADITDEKSRAKGMGMLGAAFGLGFVVGPAIGGALSLVDAESLLSFVPGINPFSAPALFALVISIANLCFLIKYFPETLQPENISHDKRPVNPLAIFRPSPHAGVNLTTWLYFVFIAAFAAMEFTITFLAKDRFAYTAFQNVALFVFIGFVVVLVQGGVVRRVVPKYGEKKVALIGWAMVIPGMLVVAVCASQWQLYVGLFLLSCGSSLLTPCLNALVSLYAPASDQGATMGIFRSFGSLARAIAPLVGAIIYWQYGSSWPYLTAGVLLIIFYLALFRLPQPGEGSTD